jgi:hypothetical protein
VYRSIVSSALSTGWVSRLEGHWNDRFDSPDVAGPNLITVVHKLLALDSRSAP